MTGLSFFNEYTNPATPAGMKKEASEEYAVSLNGKRKAGHHQQDA